VTPLISGRLLHGLSADAGSWAHAIAPVGIGGTGDVLPRLANLVVGILPILLHLRHDWVCCMVGAWQPRPAHLDVRHQRKRRHHWRGGNEHIWAGLGWWLVKIVKTRRWRQIFLPDAIKTTGWAVRDFQRQWQSGRFADANAVRTGWYPASRRWPPWWWRRATPLLAAGVGHFSFTYRWRSAPTALGAGGRAAWQQRRLSIHYQLRRWRFGHIPTSTVAHNAYHRRRTAPRHLLRRKRAAERRVC